METSEIIEILKLEIEKLQNEIYEKRTDTVSSHDYWLYVEEKQNEIKSLKRTVDLLKRRESL